jgi:hypothetical protein
LDDTKARKEVIARELHGKHFDIGISSKKMVVCNFKELQKDLWVEAYMDSKNFHDFL